MEFDSRAFAWKTCETRCRERCRLNGGDIQPRHGILGRSALTIAKSTVRLTALVLICEALECKTFELGVGRRIRCDVAQDLFVERAGVRIAPVVDIGSRGHVSVRLSRKRAGTFRSAREHRAPCLRSSS